MGAVKKLLLGILIPVGIVGALVAGFCIAFGDNTRGKYEGVKSYSNEQVFSESLINAFDTVKENKALSLNVTEDSVNQIFYNSFDKLPEQVRNFANKLYVEMSDDNYKFCLDASLWVFKTRLIIDTKLEEGKVDDKDAYIFKINSAKVGLVDVYKIVKSSGLLKTEMLQSFFEQGGLSMKIDLDKDMIYLLKEDAKNDLSKLLGSDDGSLVNPIISHLADGNNLSMNFNKDGIKILLNLASAEDNISLTGGASCEAIYDMHLNEQLETIKGNILTLMNEEQVSPTFATKLYNYFLNGYDSLSGQEQATVDAMDLSRFGISDVKAYKGITYEVAEEDKIENTAKTQAISNIIGLLPGVEKELVSISESQINKILKASSLPKTGYSLATKTHDGKYKFNYLSIDNFYCQMTKEQVNYVVGVNIAGFETRIILNTTPIVDSIDFGVGFKINDIYYGEQKASANLKDKTFSMLNEAIDSMGSECVSYDASERIINIDVKKALDDVPAVKSIIDAGGTNRTAIVGDTLCDDSQIKVYFTMNPVI